MELSKPPRLLPEWIDSLPLQQQSVLLLALRGPDGIRKYHPCKTVVQNYRGTMLRAAMYGHYLTWGEKADDFMSLREIADRSLWIEACKEYHRVVDELPHHYHLHLVHAAEILGYKHPHTELRERWHYFFAKAVDDMHLNVETEAEMDERLSDWGRTKWNPGS